MKAQWYAYHCADSLMIRILVYQITYTKKQKSFKQVLNKTYYDLAEENKQRKKNIYIKNKIMTMKKMLDKY